MKRILTTVGVVIVLILICAFYYRYYFVFGDGTKAGTMNYFVRKGYIFKTYEGKIIQSGFKAPVQNQGSIQSNEFLFSVTDEKVADELNKSAGAFIELHYKEYLHALPWRGMSPLIVDKVIDVKPVIPAKP